jgi:glutaredoxin
MRRLTRKRYHVIATNTCPWCDRAKELLESRGSEFYIDNLESQPELLSEMQNKMNHKTVPMIWEISETGDKKFIGGYSDLVQYFMKEQALKGKNLLNG